jgi:putative SOS response-associated peptidase YedK
VVAVVAVPTAHEGKGGRKAGLCRWGLIPRWAKDPAMGSRMINARGESLAQKPSFRNAFAKRRCVIPADGFFEWRKDADGKKTPLYIHRTDGKPLAFAGLWERWTDSAGQLGPPGDKVRTCTIITGSPNEFMKRIHHRMPAILDDDGVAAWLDPSLTVPAAKDVLARLFPAEAMAAHAVSTYVNKPGNEGPGCIAPVEASGPAAT